MMFLAAGLAFYLGWAGALRQGAFSGLGPVTDGGHPDAGAPQVEPVGPLPDLVPTHPFQPSEPSQPEARLDLHGTILPGLPSEGSTSSGPGPDAEPSRPRLPEVASSPGAVAGAAGAGGTESGARQGPEPRGRFAVVIDDCGQDPELERQFMGLDSGLTLAVLPHVPGSQDIAREASARGLCVLLHLPMQACGGADPGPGAILSDLEDAELARRARAAFESVPGIAGFNNHEGSLATTRPRLVRAALREAATRGLFVLDSRTSAATLLADEATRQGLPVRSRDVFLDNQDDEEQILEQLDRLASLALQRGSAVALGHPRPATLEALRQGLPRLRQAGLELVPLAALMAGN